ncbi:MAG: SpoIIE family protein phosphatase, partial [Treponema sp.]|nr:SpoIIE family protein phosphatase [Treponema sp.]
PILALNAGVREVAEGRLEHAVEVGSDDELGQLARSFNLMTGQLRSRIAEIASSTARHRVRDAELDIAWKLQRSMLPENFPTGEGSGSEIYARVHPAEKIGGDFYDFFHVDEHRIAVLVADVSGSGISAAMFMATTKLIVKSSLRLYGRPDLALEKANEELYEGNTQHMFVTMWLGILDLSSGTLSYVNAGHNPPLVRREPGGFAFLRSKPDMVLAGMSGTRYALHRSELAPTDLLFLYTDGIVEAENPNGERYGKDRLKEFLDLRGGLSLRALLPAIEDDVLAFSGEAGQTDDITMLAVRRPGPGTETDPASRRREEKRIAVKAELSSLLPLRDFLDRELAGVSCPAKARRQLELACEEVFVNIANYSYRNGPGEVRVAFLPLREGGQNGAMLTFSDTGIPFNPLDHPDPDITTPPERRESGGLGILIARNLTDTMSYVRLDGGNRLELRKLWKEEAE